MADENTRSRMLLLIIGALGVVYGDIGTSVIYAFRECFNSGHGVMATHDNVLGVLSLILWALVLVVSVKYLMVVIRANNEGEGGIFALVASALKHSGERGSHMRIKWIVILGLLGTALFAADGMITPAISVLSAVEGMELATPAFKPFVIPITLAILFGLFLVQKWGSDKIGTFFGPIMVVWFTAIGLIGIYGIAMYPSVLQAINPYYALQFFVTNHIHGLIVLGSVVLCVTGCEALYADLGHFGLKPIATAWHVPRLAGAWSREQCNAVMNYGPWHV